MAVLFHLLVAKKLTKRRRVRRNSTNLNPSTVVEMGRTIEISGSFSRQYNVSDSSKIAIEEEDTHIVLMVTCYSEGESSIRGTLESLAATDYPDDRKLLFVVADGIITGKDNLKSTPDIIIDMIQQTNSIPPEAKSYLAIADGSKQHNMAKVYSGYYVFGSRKVPIIAIIKTGTPSESKSPKPGNRGKRDSQIIFMNFFSRIMFDDRLTQLEYEIFSQIQSNFKITPDKYSLVLMVDADTVVALDSLRNMTNAMENDENIIGLCGETKIANKRTNWVTLIQVFEYYISHHLGKSFESMFGGNLLLI